MRGIKYNAVPPLWWECGWGIGVAIALLQFSCFMQPEGESRDWLQYFLIGGWAALYGLSAHAGILSARAGIVLRKAADYEYWVRALPYVKIAMTVYALLAISYYFLPPPVNLRDAAVWAVALLLSAAWVRRLEATGMRRFGYGAMMAWHLLGVFYICRTLLYRAAIPTLPWQYDELWYLIPFAIALAFTAIAIWRPYRAAKKPAAHKGLYAVLHVAALYVLAIPFFRVEHFANLVAIHHWKAYLGPVESIRSGGWLLWDVPSQYGFLQALAVAALPVASAWQSLYLVNGAMLALTGYIVFRALFAQYRSASGFVFCFAVAFSSTVLLLPMGNGIYYPFWTVLVSGKVFSVFTTGNPLVFPSTGALRFFWIYPVAGYVFYLAAHFSLLQGKTFSRWRYAGGHMLWLLGALWSAESAVFVTVIWLPSLVLVAAAEACAGGGRPPLLSMARLAALRVGQLAGMAAVLYAAMALFYYLALGQLPDAGLFIAYACAYTGGFNTFPILTPGMAPCWLLMFFMMLAMARLYLMRATVSAAMLLHAAALYAAMAAVWAACSYFVPLSDDVHLACTLPILIYVSALLLRLLPGLDIPEVMKAGFEKVFLCLCGFILWGTVSYFDERVYTQQSWLAPIHADVASLLPVPPASLQSLLDEAQLPEHPPMLLLSEVFTEEELAYVKGVVPWLLPNTPVGYELPLPKETYRVLAERRAARSGQRHGWIIERKDNPLERYYWIRAAIKKYYRQVQVLENSTYRLRKFERLPDAEALRP